MNKIPRLFIKAESWGGSSSYINVKEIKAIIESKEYICINLLKRSSSSDHTDFFIYKNKPEYEKFLNFLEKIIIK